MKKRSFDVELGWIREFALREKKAILSDALFSFNQFPVVKRD